MARPRNLFRRARPYRAPSAAPRCCGPRTTIISWLRHRIRFWVAGISWPCATKFERPNLISWLRHKIRSFDDHNTEAPHSAVDTGAPDGPNFAAVPRNSPVVVAENFGTPRSGPEIPECSSLRIYSRIPRSLLVIRPVIAPAPRAGVDVAVVRAPAKVRGCRGSACFGSRCPTQRLDTMTPGGRIQHNERLSPEG